MVATIQYIEQTIATYREATEANWRTPGRVGNVVKLDEELADEVLVTADLHGHRRNFNAIRQLSALDRHPRRHLVMQEVCHGGPLYASNGGDMSHTMLEDVARLKTIYPARLHYILSNHELAEATDYPILKAKRMLNLLFRLGMQEAYGAAAEKVRQAYVEFIKSCPLAVQAGNVFISHTLPERLDAQPWDRTVLERELEGVDYLERGDVFRMVWGRDFRPENAAAFAKIVGAEVLIHGHEPCEGGHQEPNDRQIILDCASEQACCLTIPVGQKLTHAELVKRIQPLR